MAPEQQPDPGSAAPAYPYPGPAYPVPPAPQPPKKQRKGLVFSITVVVLLLLIGGGVGLSRALKSSPTADDATPTPSATQTSASPSPSPSPTEVLEPTFYGDLRTMLVAAPKGSHAWYKPLTKDGNLTVDEMASNYTDPKAVKADLIEAGFKRGAARQWIASNGNAVQIQIVQFRDYIGASSQSTREVDGIMGGYSDLNPTDEGQFGDVHDSRFIISKKADSDGDFYAAGVASHGDILMEVEIWMAKSNEASAKALVQQQFDKIVAAMA